ncbi:MAG: carboxypeptidase regulatory-like domain-containing protein [Candidatus Zixiibacteriota bacterium]|nr:MAG: carboxypeptidase regulatory-like domain-containing protein [candidate division Zixibacteria bacterium]
MNKKSKISICIVALLIFCGPAATSHADSNKGGTEREYYDDSGLYPPNTPVILEHGGPDPGGYYFIDSDDPALNAPIFNWTDISNIGIPVLLDDDDNEGPFPIGFSFSFYGEVYDSFYVCSNGFVSFTSTSIQYNNRPIPFHEEPNCLLAIFWDDLNPENGGQVYYYSDTTTNQLVISFDGVPHYTNFGSLHFQVLLNGDDSSIVYHYGFMDDGGHGNNGATIGIENSDGTIGTQYIFNQPGIHDSMAVYFGFDPPYFGEHEVRPAAFVDLPEYGMVGDTVFATVTFVNQGANIEDFPVRLIVKHNGNEVYNETEQIAGLEPFTAVDVTFPAFMPALVGDHQFIAISELSGDENPANDTIYAYYYVYGSMYYEGFELTNGTFAGGGDWQWGEPTSGPNGAHSGTKLWATGLAGNYSNFMLAHLVSPPLAILDNAFIGFWHWYNIEAYWDGGNVKISTDNGVTWSVITPDGGYDGVANSANPLSGEEIFTGYANARWQFETFDLSAYAGMAVLFRFDFGSDDAVTYPGWYIDDFTIYGGAGAEPGYIAGTVTELATGDPIPGAVVVAGNVADTTDVDGNYILELIAGTYSVTASATYYNPRTVNGIEVIEGGTTYRNFSLTAPSIQADTTPIAASVSWGDTALFTRNIANTGNGNLEFTVSISIGDRVMNVQPEIRPAKNPAENLNRPLSNKAEYSPAYIPGDPPVVLDFGDELFRFDAETPSGDERILGVEFDGMYFWFTGANNLIDHKLHKFDINGNYIESFDQGTSSTWGWRDLAWDGEYLYASDENEFAIIDPATGQKIGELPIPTVIIPPLRALAWDPVTDHFWTANWDSPIIEFDRTGNVINSFFNSKSIYGMAWDDESEGGPFLWVYSQEGAPATEISQFDPIGGEYTGISFYAVDSSGNDAIAGGICFTTEWDPSLGMVFCVIQDDPDVAAGYEITPASQWLIVDPMSGIIAPAQNVDLTIVIDFRGDDIVPDTTYEASIMLINNSPDTPEIPVTIDVVTGIDDNVSNLPREVALYQNYPNPFNPNTGIKFALPEQMDVKIEIFNILGQKTAMIAEGLFPAGYHSVTWDGGNAASGVYYYKLTAGDKTIVKKMTLLK